MKTRKRLVRKIRWERVLAGLLCLCMMLQMPLQHDTVSAYKTVDVEDNSMHVMVYHWHAVEATPGETIPVLGLNETYDRGVFIPSVEPVEREGEEFVAFSVSVGQDAVTINDTSVDIKNDPNVHLVKVHVFYAASGEKVEGVEFGEQFKGDVKPEEDTKTLLFDQYKAKFPDKTIEEGTESVKLYNTDRGLHTDKTAVESDLESLFSSDGTDEAGSRTFDVKLESWVSDANLANVALILDASGSMAFTSDLSSELNGDIVTVSGEQLKKLGDIDKENGVKWLSQKQVDMILNKNYTSNSLMDYSDYSYFIYEGRETTKEYTPLGYWDGTATVRTGVDPIGYYSFDNTLQNDAPNASFNDEAKASLSDAKTPEYTTSSEKGFNGQGRALKLYDSVNGKNYDVTLDVGLEDAKNFTLSFAVYNSTGDGDILGRDTNAGNPGYQNIVDIIDDKNPDKYYSAGRGDRTKGGAANRIKTYTGTSGAILNVNDVFKNNTTWTVLTYVVETDESGTTITVYVNGEQKIDAKATWNKTIDPEKVIEGSAKIIFGGQNVDGQKGRNGEGDDLWLDEVYVFDEALDGSQVKALFDNINAGVTIATKAGKKIAGIHSEFQSALGALSVQKRAGWYYVNSTSNDLNIVLDDEIVGSSKELRGLVKHENGKNGYYFFNDSNIPENHSKKTDIKIEVDHRGTAPWGEENEYAQSTYNEIKDGPCKFYLDDENRLCCVFSPSNKAYSYSYVYYKPDEDKIKREKLQEAVGNFIIGLNQSSPESSIAAVRFSTEKFGDEPLDVSKLGLLNWTNKPEKGAALMNLTQGGGTALGSDEGQYNYVLTGGTSVATGLQAFNKTLLPSAPHTEDDRVPVENYLIIFTDGIDASIEDIKDEEAEEKISSTNNKAVELANGLKEQGWTIYCIMLPSLGQKMDGKAATFLGKLSSAKTPEERKDYVFNADDTKEEGGLQQAFANISKEIVYELSGYSVKDYIDPRFDLVARQNGSSDWKLIRLNAGGNVSIETAGKPETAISQNIATGGLDVIVNASGAARNAKLCWDGRKKMAVTACIICSGRIRRYPVVR